MIQRIQSLYLLVASILVSLSLFTPFLNVTDELLWITGLYIFFQAGPFWLSILFIISILCPFVTIFLFKNRSLQIKLTQLSILITASLIGGTIFYLSDYTSQNTIDYNYSIAGAFIALSVVFLVLAIRAIKKDEALIRSADRIR